MKWGTRFYERIELLGLELILFLFWILNACDVCGLCGFALG
jgi:hypothetical protein